MTFTQGFALPPRNINILSYQGPSLYFTPAKSFQHAPTTSDRNYPILTLGMYQNPIPDGAGNSNGDLWYLANFTPASPGLPLLANWRKLSTGGSGPLLMVATPLGTTPVAPNGAGVLAFTSSGGTVQITGNQAGHSINFDITGGGAAIEGVILQTGVSPIHPTDSGNITIAGTLLAQNGHPLRTDGTTSSTCTIEAQISGTDIVSIDSTLCGMSQYNGNQFTVDANGWVSLKGGTGPTILSLSDNANVKVDPDGTGNIKLAAGTGITTVSNPGSNLITIGTVGNVNPIGQFTTNIAGPVVPSSGNVFVNASVSTFTDGATANTLKTEVQGTNHAVFVGRGTNVAATTITPGVDFSVFQGVTGGDPVWTSQVTNFVPTFVNFNGAYTAPGPSGRYVRYGRIVFVFVEINWSGNTMAGDMIVQNLPFIFSTALSIYPAVVNIQGVALPAGTIQVVADGNNNTTNSPIQAVISGAANSPVQMDTGGGTGSLAVTYIYPGGT